MLPLWLHVTEWASTWRQQIESTQQTTTFLERCRDSADNNTAGVRHRMSTLWLARTVSGRTCQRVLDQPASLLSLQGIAASTHDLPLNSLGLVTVLSMLPVDNFRAAAGLFSPAHCTHTQQIRSYSMPHWQNVEVTAEGEPQATVIKSQDNNTFTIRDRASESCEEGRQPTLYFVLLLRYQGRLLGQRKPNLFRCILSRTRTPIAMLLFTLTGATPISHFLGAIVSGSQGALTSSAKEMNLQVGHVKWHATGKYDVRGIRGEEVSPAIMP